MTMVKVRLLKPLNNLPEGTETEFDKSDIAHLKAMHAIEELSEDEDEASAPVEKPLDEQPDTPPAEQPQEPPIDPAPAKPKASRKPAKAD
jgi:hypothetical protein